MMVRDENQNLAGYERLTNLAVILIYIQIGCSLIGSRGALYNGVLLINLGIALFALNSIESNNPGLAATYAVLLFCAILLDVSWFIFFSHHIWNMSSEGTGMLFIISLRLTLAMEIVGFCVRFFSSVVWIRMYRLDLSLVAAPIFDPVDSNLSEDHQQHNINSSLGHNDGVSRNGYSSPEISEIKSSPVSRTRSR